MDTLPREDTALLARLEECLEYLAPRELGHLSQQVVEAMVQKKELLAPPSHGWFFHSPSKMDVAQLVNMLSSPSPLRLPDQPLLSLSVSLKGLRVDLRQSIQG